MKFKKIALILLICFIISGLAYADAQKSSTKITISAIGDCTLGTDANDKSSYSFDSEVKRQKYNYGYFFSGVTSVLKNDDITIANLETTLTDYSNKQNKQFRFKGSPSYTNILKKGSVEAVNLANNHTYDYLQRGFSDTVNNLKNAGIPYFGYDYKYKYYVKGVKVGLLGYKGWDATSTAKQKIKSDIKYMKKDCSIVIVSFHWGDEGKYYPNNIQKNLGHYAIDNGADLVLGHHPHVVEGIEKYKGKNIVYSLGNFCFGGNKNPKDKDTFIYQQSFTVVNKKLTNISEKIIIPCSLSTENYRNDYRPRILTGSEKNRVYNKILSLSKVLK